MKKSIYSVLMAVLITGCQIDEVRDAQKSSGSIFMTEMEMFGEVSKTSMSSDLKVVWSHGDQLTIFKGSYMNDKYQVEEQYVGKPYGDFKLVGEESSGNDFSSGTELPANIAIYPYNKDLTVAKDGGAYVVSGVVFPSVQEYSEKSFGEGSFIMAAVTESLQDHKLKFKNVGGALKLQLKGTGTVKTITVKGNNNEILSGVADITVSSTSVPTPEFTSSSKEVTLNCGTNGVSLKSSETTDFIISLPAVNFTKGFIVTITDINGNTEEISTSNLNNIQRSSVLNMPERTIVFDNGDTGVPQMYYGYVPSDILLKYKWNISKGISAVTYDWINESIDKGTMIKTDLEKLGKVTFDEIPEDSFVLFALPSSCGLEVTQTLVLNEGGKFSLNGSNHGNGEHKIKIGGKSYDCYGTFEGYARNNYICYIDLPKEPQLFYGYISPEMMAKYNLSPSSSYDQITADCINACLDKGTLIRNDVDTMSETSFGDVPANSLLVVGVAEKSIYAAFKSTSDADKSEFEGLSSSNGECTTWWYGEEYLLYGEYISTALSKDNSSIRFQIGYRPNTEGKLPMYIGYIPDPDVKILKFSDITSDMITSGVNKGEIFKTDARTIEYDGEGFGNVPAKSFIVIALPQSSGLKATTWNIIEGDMPFSVKPLSNGDVSIVIDGNTYRLYGEYTKYALIKDSEEIYYKIKKDPSQPQTLPMYIGYIPDPEIKIKSYSDITTDMILNGVSKGEIVKSDSQTVQCARYPECPAKSFLLIALPQSSGLTAVNFVETLNKEYDFTANPVSNGENKLTIDGEIYLLYGERVKYGTDGAILNYRIK